MPNHKPSIEHKRRLNPPMQEVVKKEIIKWLDARVIYPIADSSWVCPNQCVHKKGGMTIVPNEWNELVTIRLVTGSWILSITWNWMHGLGRTIPWCPSWTRCYIDSQEKDGIVFLMAVRVTTIFLLPRMIKRRPPLFTHIGRSYSRGCLLGYVIYRQLSRGV